MKGILFILLIGFGTSYAASNNSFACPDSIKVPASFCVSCETFDNEFKLDIACFVSKFSFSIFNNENKKVFSSTLAKFVWDGKDENGFKVTKGTYVWHMNFTYQTRKYQKKGFLTIF